MAKTDRLDPEKIIEIKHAKAAFSYIRKHGQQKGCVRHYKTTPHTKNVWVVKFKGEKYWYREALKLSYLFALRDKGEAETEKPPFPATYKKRIPPHWIKTNLMKSIWNSMGLTPWRSKLTR